jgi:hypothetical protein
VGKRRKGKRKKKRTIGVLEQNLAVDAARSDEGRVERLDFVGGHDDLDVATIVEAVQLVQQLKHGALDLAFAARGRLVPLGADGVDLIDEDNGRRVLGCDLEELAHEPGPVAQVLLDELAADDT